MTTTFDEIRKQTDLAEADHEAADAAIANLKAELDELKLSIPSTPALPSGPAAGTLKTILDESFASGFNSKLWRPGFKWMAPNGSGHNDELQWYPGDQSRLAVVDGIMRLTAAKGGQPAGVDTKRFPYTAGCMSSLLEFTYGIVEVRARMPKGTGAWPAIWMLPGDFSWPPEPDIMENLGKDPKTIHMHSHIYNSSKANNDEDNGASYTAAFDFFEDFHTFTFEWSKNRMAWYIDGKEARPAITNAAKITSKACYLILNLALGGWGGPVNEAAIPGMSFDVDYCKVWQRV